MSDDKLKQNHVFVKNNVGSLALHKAKQEKKESENKMCDETDILIFKKTLKRLNSLEDFLDNLSFYCEEQFYLKELIQRIELRLKHKGLKE